MGDENWIYGYEPETKQQLSQWKSPQSPRGCSLFFCFFDVKGIVCLEFVPPNNMVISGFYCDILKRLKENVR
jgi:hypothetical protein